MPRRPRDASGEGRPTLAGSLTRGARKYRLLGNLWLYGLADWGTGWATGLPVLFVLGAAVGVSFARQIIQLPDNLMVIS